MLFLVTSVEVQNNEAQFGTNVYVKLKYSKTIVFTCLGNEYFSFEEYFILGKKRSGLKSPIRQKK
jgi:hypothetical protein